MFNLSLNDNLTYIPLQGIVTTTGTDVAINTYEQTLRLGPFKTSTTQLIIIALALISILFIIVCIILSCKLLRRKKRQPYRQAAAATFFSDSYSSEMTSFEPDHIRREVI